MSENRLIFQAIARLLDASNITDEIWATILGCKPEKINNWRLGNDYPSDREMTAMLNHLEHVKGSKHCPEVPAALDAFWETAREWETNHKFTELQLRTGDQDASMETAAERLTRFTNDGWLENISRNIHLIPPRRRRAFIDATRELFNTFTED